MAGWSLTQQQRLGIEKTLLEKYFPNCVTWIDPRGDTKVEIALTTNNDKKYVVRIYLKSAGSASSDFPNSLLDMVVVRSPKSMPKWGVDGENHTLGYRDGFLKICHYNSNHWTSSSTLYEVAMKGRIWIEAYEAHRKTKKAMSSLLAEME